MTDLTERLRKRAEEDAKCAENSKVVADLLRPQLEAFEANEDKGNVYAIRMAVDHRNSVKRDGQYAADLREAAATLETLTQENARLREALRQHSLVTLIGMINAAGGKITVHPRDVENAVNQEVIAYYDPTNDTKVYRVRARKALGGGDE